MSSAESTFHPDDRLTDAAPAAIPQPAQLPPVAALGFGLHPNFWWAVLWCVALLLFTQMPGLVVAVVLIAALLLGGVVAPTDIQTSADLLGNEAVQLAIGVSIAVAHGLIILFSLAVLRVVAGRDWTRQVGLRRPSLPHTALVIAAAPAFLLLANGVYHLVKHQLGFPSAATGGGVGAIAAFIVAIAAAVAELGVVVLLLRLAVGRHWHRRLAGDSPVRAALLSGGLIAAFVGLAVGQYLGLRPMLSDTFGGAATADMSELEKMITGWPAVLAVLLVGVLPGVSEELWCRGFLGRGLVGQHGYFWGVLLTSFLFGAIHVDPCQGTMAMALGVVLHCVYLTTRSLWLPMLLHFLNNALAVTLPRLEPIKAFLHEPGAVAPAVYVAAGVLLAAVGWALYESRARLAAPAGEEAWRPAYSGVAWPPPDSGTHVERPWPSAVAVVGVGLALAALAVAIRLTAGGV